MPEPDLGRHERLSIRIVLFTCQIAQHMHETNYT